ncbi:MAG: type IX secretion system membrane protein PorP/SprF [Bacteroidota bacterium]|nr:type IX secretion system membrane protein PorP/SprF [Bacteroidota bacterium]
MKKKSLFLALISLGMMLSVKGQNQSSISQYMLHHAFINPAAIGSEDKINGAVFHRSQWVGMDGAPATQGLNFNNPFDNGKHTVGLTIFNDRISIHRNTSVAATYAYRMQVSAKSNLVFGLSSVLELRQSRFSEADPDMPFDPVFMENSRVFAAPNFRFGIYYYAEKYYVGFAAPNILESHVFKGTTGFNATDLHMYLHGGYSFSLSENIDFNASTLIRHVAGAPMQIDINPQIVFQNILAIGFSYRTSNEIAAMVNIPVTPMLKIGYAYDHAFSSLKKYTSGSHEIMLIFNMQDPKRPVTNKAPRY